MVVGCSVLYVNFELRAKQLTFFWSTTDIQSKQNISFGQQEGLHTPGDSFDDSGEWELDAGGQGTNRSVNSYGTDSMASKHKKKEWLIRMNKKLADIPVGELDPQTLPITAIMNVSWIIQMSINLHLSSLIALTNII